MGFLSDFLFTIHTVDGRNPKPPPGMYKILEKLG